MRRRSGAWMGNSKDAAPSVDMVANSHLQLRARLKNHVHARSEFDQTHALSARQPVANALPEYDTAGHCASDLLDDHPALLAFDREDVLLIAHGSLLLGGNAKSARVIRDIPDNAGNR